MPVTEGCLQEPEQSGHHAALGMFPRAFGNTEHLYFVIHFGPGPFLPHQPLFSVGMGDPPPAPCSKDPPGGG